MQLYILFSKVHSKYTFENLDNNVLNKEKRWQNVYPGTIKPLFAPWPSRRWQLINQFFLVLPTPSLRWELSWVKCYIPSHFQHNNLAYWWGRSKVLGLVYFSCLPWPLSLLFQKKCIYEYIYIYISNRYYITLLIALYYMYVAYYKACFKIFCKDITTKLSCV